MGGRSSREKRLLTIEQNGVFRKMFHNDKDPLEIVSDKSGITEASAIIDSISPDYIAVDALSYTPV